MSNTYSSSYTATVKFTSSKGCFVYIPETWFLDSNQDINVFKLYYGENKEAFVSCLPSKQVNDLNPYILINAKFAEKLELTEKEKIFLERINSPPSYAKEIILEPLTADDWEILELNATTIEKELMNQIRVVWINQIFPVWINNISIYAKIAQTNPNSLPVLLVEFSEVHIVPKERHLTQIPSKPETPDKKLSPFSQFYHLRSRKSYSPRALTKYNAFFKENVNDDSPSFENKSATARALSLLSSFFSNSRDDKINECRDESMDDEFTPLKLEGILRVIPYTRTDVPPLHAAVQATTVFINATTYLDICGHTEEIPPCFVGVLRKYPTPESRKEKKQLHQQKSKDQKDVQSNDSSLKSLERSRSKSDISITEERQKLFNSVCVTVMVIRSPEEDEFNLPLSLYYTKNVIVVPKELKKCLNLEVASLVHLKGVQARPIGLNKIALHISGALPSKTTSDIIFANFEKWAFGTNEPDTSYVISDGTLLSFRIFGQKCDFFINLQSNLDQTVNASSSSINTVSPSSSTSEENSIQKDPVYGYLTKTNINKISVTCGSQMCLSVYVDRPYLKNIEGLYLDFKSATLNDLGGIKQLADQALESLEFWLKLRPISYVSNHPFTFCGSMLICGPKGVGKSSLANALCKKLSMDHHIFVKVISCLPYKGKRVDIIAKKWDDYLTEAVHNQPSVILFEDFDFIASSPTSHEQEAGPEGVYFSNIVQAFVHFINKVKKSESKLAIIATAQSTHSLHPILMNTKGRHIFQSVIDIKPPDIEDRMEILRALVIKKDHISNKSIDSVAWSKIAAKTEGYVAQDLDSLVDRATHAAWVRMADVSRAHEITLNVEDLEMALEGYIPSSLQGIPLQVHDHKSWSDVGGLSEVKKVVQQIIMWPFKYKQIFKNYSLKPQTNILLYGAPGTGKTLLAGVIANECGLNFISIKGPELLSKYIGASEQAIRDLFKRAAAAKPCILFFDEFDSIAPRRGHDSTGVTDRVVNQLLTQLDGVELLEGVHVLAASSRPELIDPALLRPGRLDKCLLCPLPNEEERLEILRCLSSKLPLNDGIDFEIIASMTENFSGADLQALLYTAHIEALHDAQSTSTRRYSTSSKDLSYTVASDKLLYMPTIHDGLKTPTYEDGQKIIQDVAVIKENYCGILDRRSSRRGSTLLVSISQNNLIKVTDSMKPSVSAQERQRYERVFKNFQNGSSGEPVTNIMETIKRVTLA